MTPKTESAIVDYTATFKAEVDAAFSDLGHTGDRTWLRQALPKGQATPYALINGGEEQESPTVRDKDSSPVILFPQADVWSDDEIEAAQVVGALIERITDDANVPAPSGWQVYFSRLNYNIQIQDRSTEGPDHYGRSVQFEIHLEPTS